MKKRILIIGAAGFIGSNLVRYLLYSKNNYYLIGVDKIKESKNIHNIYLNKSCDFYIADACDKDIMLRIFEITRPNIVINLIEDLNTTYSLLKSIGEYKKLFNINIKIIQMSSADVYKESKDLDEASTINSTNENNFNCACGEFIVKNYCNLIKAKYNIVRPDFVFGPRQCSIDDPIKDIYCQVKFNKKIKLSNKGSLKRNLVYIEDFNNAIISIIEKGSDDEVYNISSGVDFTDLEIAFNIKELIDKEIQIEFNDVEIDSKYKEIDSNKLRELGWKPKLSFKERLNQTIQWFENNPWFFK
jgi:dTDP-glucose 4,6-dehydratase